jgi:hypothetical protein
MNKVPCYGCTKRNADCHTYCMDYLEWVKLNNERKNQIRKNKSTYVSFNEISVRRHYRKLAGK